MEQKMIRGQVQRWWLWLLMLSTVLVATVYAACNIPWTLNTTLPDWLREEALAETYPTDEEIRRSVEAFWKADPLKHPEQP
jgi:hypothetical protein